VFDRVIQRKILRTGLGARRAHGRVFFTNARPSAAAAVADKRRARSARRRSRGGLPRPRPAVAGSRRGQRIVTSAARNRASGFQR
jgi:hypothetical protein